MRIAYFAILGLMLAASPALAQSASVPRFGSYNCPQQVPCEDDGSVEASQWSALGNSCMMNGFGLSTPDGFFDDIAGLNGSQCLTAKDGAIFNSIHLHMAPVCCVIKLPTNSCILHCDLVQG